MCYYLHCRRGFSIQRSTWQALQVKNLSAVETLVEMLYLHCWCDNLAWKPPRLFLTLHWITLNLYFSCCISMNPSVVERDKGEELTGWRDAVFPHICNCLPPQVWLTRKSEVKLYPWQKAPRTSAGAHCGWHPPMESQGQLISFLPRSQSRYSNKLVPG